MATVQQKLKAYLRQLLPKQLDSTASPSPVQTEPIVQKRFLENRKIPIRLSSRSSYSVWQQTLRIWNIVIMSLPFDLVFLFTSLHFSARSTDLLRTLSYTLLAVACLGLAREPAFDFFDACRRKYKSLTAVTQNYSWLAVLITLAVIAVEALARFGQLGLLAIVGVIFVGLRVGLSARKMLREHQRHRQSLESDRTLLIDQLNIWLFLITTLPILAARLAMLGFAVATQAAQSGRGALYDWAPQALTAIALLFALLPQQEHFVVNCPRCARWTSRALKNFGYCPACAREEFQIVQESNDSSE